MKLSGPAAMKLAIEEAKKGGPRVSPNPLVGSVVVSSDGRLLASGYHELYGGPHAEANALRGLSKEQLQDATVYVTLEPCAHQGKTPSCAKMMAKLPLKKVVYGIVDPNPLVAGQGVQILKEAGFEVELFTETHPEFKDDLEEVCEAFLWNYRHQAVFVSLKIAQSLDGQIALSSGESKWITNAKAREETHWIRACHDAVLVGRGTVTNDNPALDIRHPKVQKTNKVVVIDPSGRLLDESSQLKVTRTHIPENLFWCVGKLRGSSAVSETATILRIEEHPNRAGDKSQTCQLDLKDLLRQLWNAGIRSVMIEGGAHTASEFLRQSLVQRLYVFQAPILLGSGGARSWTETLILPAMKDQLRLRNPKVIDLEDNLLVTGRLD